MLFTCLPPGAADPRPVSRPGACPRQMVLGRYPLPHAVRAGARQGAGGQPAEPAPPPRQPGDRRRHRRASGPGAAAAAVARAASQRHGYDGHRRAGGVALARPDLLRAAGRPRDRGDPHGQRQHRRHLRQAPRPLLRSRHRAVPGAGAGGRRAGAAAQIARPARHRDRRQRPGRGPVGREIPPGLRQMRGAGPGAVHAPDRLYRDQPHGAVAPRQFDRQPARIDGGGASSDLRRRARPAAGAEAGDRAWRRVPAGLFRAHRPRRGGPPRHLRVHPPRPDLVSEAALFRHDGVQPPPARISGRDLGRRPHPDGHRLPVRHGRDRPDRLCRGRRKAQRRRPQGDPRRQRRAASEHPDQGARQ